MALLGSPAEASTHARRKPHRPSRAHLKIKAELAQAIADDAGSGHELGAASFYGIGFHGRRGANGEVFDVRKMTAASNRYPLGTWIAVQRLDSEQCVVVKVTDRMHHRHRTRVIDLSLAAASRLHMMSAGVVLVRLMPLTSAPGESLEKACKAVFARGGWAGYRPCETCDATKQEPAAQPQVPTDPNDDTVGWTGLPAVRLPGIPKASQSEPATSGATGLGRLPD